MARIFHRGKLARWRASPVNSENVHPGVGAIDNVDIAAIIDFDVVCLNGHFATLAGFDLDAALIRLARGRRNIVPDLTRPVWIADVYCTYARVDQDMNTMRFAYIGGMFSFQA